MANEFDDIEFTRIGETNMYSWSHPVAKQLFATHQVDPERTLHRMLVSGLKCEYMYKSHWIRDYCNEPDDIEVFYSVQSGKDILQAFHQWIDRVCGSYLNNDMLLFDMVIVDRGDGSWAIYRSWVNQKMLQQHVGGAKRPLMSHFTLKQLTVMW